MKLVKMKLKTLNLMLVTLSLLSSNTIAQNIALSFDDGLDPTRQVNAKKWNSEILTHLSSAKIKSIYYVAGHRVDSEQGLSLVSDWGKQGHSIANHSYSHKNFASDKISLERFIADVKKNEALLENMPNWTKRFRFPYLKEGKTVSKRDGFRDWMAQQGYQTGAVSIDASDWYYNRRYLNWLKQHPNDSPSVIKSAYLKHLWNRAKYYDALANQVLNRSADHVLLLHTNAINAAFLSDVIEMFKSKGWHFIAPEQAYKDPLYALQTDVLPAGESVLWSLAKQNKLKGLRYPAEDSVYEKPILDKLVGLNL
jgi:peptidoglycan/xylan/chitin deacetylase (PgdA/CDA1 family)